MRPDDNPLPWCDALEMPWWRINMSAILTLPHWQAWQAGKPMERLIPVLGWLLHYDASTRSLSLGSR